MKIFGERLRELREEEKLSARDLADKIGVSDASIIRWENNQINPSIECLYALAVYFKVSADYLLGLED